MHIFGFFVQVCMTSHVFHWWNTITDTHFNFSIIGIIHTPQKGHHDSISVIIFMLPCVENVFFWNLFYGNNTYQNHPSFPPFYLLNNPHDNFNGITLFTTLAYLKIDPLPNFLSFQHVPCLPFALFFFLLLHINK